jgi:hypothetical protein
MNTQRWRTTRSGPPGVDLSASDKCGRGVPASGVRDQDEQQVTHRERYATGSVAEFRHHDSVPLLNAQAARALLRLLEGARERRQQEEKDRKVS